MRFDVQVFIQELNTVSENSRCFLANSGIYHQWCPPKEETLKPWQVKESKGILNHIQNESALEFFDY